jgi:hypothetical protein
MSLFDSIRCDYPLPDPRVQDAEFQTKDLGESLGRYTITKAGRLVRHRQGVDLITGEASAGQSVDSRPGVDVGYHGDIRIQAMLPGNGTLEYVFRFTHGTVEWIRPSLKTMPAGNGRSLAELADFVDQFDRERSASEEALLCRLESLDPEVAARAIDVFDDRGKAASWLSRPNRALGHVTPLRVLARGGRQEVLDVLGRILHGIPS